MAVFVMSTAVVLNGTVNAQDTFACSPGRYSCNAPESVARSRCALNEGAQGAMWFNTSDNAANESGYYSATVNVSPTSSTVRVNLRGSVNSCADSSRYTAYAVNISPSGSNAGRLTGLAGSVLNRGSMPGSRTTWSSQGSSLGADLNVSGLAMNNAGRADSQSIVIGIYRCFSTNGSRPTGSCFATDVEVTVVREAGPNFNLNPSITGTPDFIESGSSSDNQISLAPVVNNIGTTASAPAQWHVVTFNVAPGAPIPTGGTDNSPGEAHYGNRAVRIAQGNQSFPANGATSLPIGQQTIGDLPIGTRVCYGLSVQPVTQDYPGWRSSDPFCVTVGKKPKVQILGNDLFVGRLFAGATGAVPTSNIKTSTTTKSATFGSWTEYLASATGTVTGLGSGASYSGDAASSDICGASLLTLANTGNASPCTNGLVKGGYKSNRSMPDIAGASIPTAALPAVTSLTNLNGVYSAPLNMTITGGDIPAGRTVIINSPNSTITIDGDITYTTGPLTSIGQIPQVIIIAANIRIKGVNENAAVRQIDAWLIARDTINTCYDAGSIAALTINLCKATLTVNGPVMTNKLFLWRTGGSESGAGAGDPAEVFNFRPDAYLWTISQNSKSGRLETVYERELPPRF